MQQGSEVNFQNHIVDKPLMQAVVKGEVEAAKALSQLGASLTTTRNIRGERPIVKAFQSDRLDVIYELILTSPTVLRDIAQLL